jgi:uncharacterized protein (TIGR02996 family)
VADPHEQRLLDAIRRDPDDDGARMVYADWLLERGDPYGELISAALAGDDDRVRALRDTERAAVTARMPGWARYPEVERGMVCAFETTRAVDDVLAPPAIAELVALAPVPIVRCRPPPARGGMDMVFRDVLVRHDGAVVAVVTCSRPADTHVVEVFALPARTALARAVHPIDVARFYVELRFIATGDHNRLRFAPPGRDAFTYDLVIDKAAASPRRPHALAFDLGRR